jgi:hypothetical protein
MEQSSRSNLKCPIQNQTLMRSLVARGKVWQVLSFQFLLILTVFMEILRR